MWLRPIRFFSEVIVSTMRLIANRIVGGSAPRFKMGGLVDYESVPSTWGDWTLIVCLRDLD